MDEMARGFLDAAGLDAPRLAYCLVAVLAGAYLKGYTGFGASMLWVTSLSLLLPPLQVVPMVLIFEIATSVILLPKIWKDVRWQSIGLLLLGTWAATPIGIYALASLPATPLRIALAIIVFIAAILIWRGFALTRELGPADYARRRPHGWRPERKHGNRRPTGDPVLFLFPHGSGCRPCLDHCLLHRHG